MSKFLILLVVVVVIIVCFYFFYNYIGGTTTTTINPKCTPKTTPFPHGSSESFCTKKNPTECCGSSCKCQESLESCGCPVGEVYDCVQEKCISRCICTHTDGTRVTLDPTHIPTPSDWYPALGEDCGNEPPHTMKCCLNKKCRPGKATW